MTEIHLEKSVRGKKIKFPPSDGNLFVQFKAIRSTCQNHKLFTLHIPNVCQSLVMMKTSTRTISDDDHAEDDDNDHYNDFVTFLWRRQ